MHTDGFHHFRQMVVFGKTHAAITIATQGLGREK
jgi:hypothetical protein